MADASGGMSRLAESADAARRLALEAALAAGSSHIGSSLSLIDLVDRAAAGRDVAGGPAAAQQGPRRGGLLRGARPGRRAHPRARCSTGYCRDGGTLAGHPERGYPGVEITGGSLGHGPSIAIGLALADRHDRSHRRTYCVVGDGELNEGSVWEAIALAGHLRLTNLTIAVDANGLQGLGRSSEILDLEPLAAKLEAFGWSVARGRRPRPRGAAAGAVGAAGPPARGRRPHGQGLRRRLPGGRRDVALPLVQARSARPAAGRARGAAGGMRDAFFAELAACAARGRRDLGADRRPRHRPVRRVRAGRARPLPERRHRRAEPRRHRRRPRLRGQDADRLLDRPVPHLAARTTRCASTSRWPGPT